MTALDTNILVRVVTADDPEQLPAALAVMRSDVLRISKTVLLETEWVLRYSYKLSQEIIRDAFVRLLGIANLSVEDNDSVMAALEWYGEGMDFADALHLSSAATADEFATFDKRLANKSAALKTVPAVRLLGVSRQDAKKQSSE